MTELIESFRILREEFEELKSKVHVQEGEIRRLRKRVRSSKREGEEEGDPFREITKSLDSHRNWLLDDMRREREKSKRENEKIRMEELKSEVVEQILQDQRKEIENLKIALRSERKQRKDEIKQLRRLIQDQIKTKQENEMKRFKNSIVDVLNKKAYTVDVQRALREKTEETQNDISVLKEELRLEYKDSLSGLQEYVRLVEVSLDVFKNEAEARVKAEQIFPSSCSRTIEETRQHDRIQLENRLREITSEMRKALSRKIDTDKCEAILRDKVDEISFAQHTKKLTTKLRELETRVQISSEDDDLLSPIRGRWIWQSGTVGTHRCATWNIECINTDTSNFGFSVGSENIILNRPGLYKLELCLFMSSDPTISVLVNDKAVLSSSSSSSSSSLNVGVGSKKRRKSGPRGNRSDLVRYSHEAGQVTGWSLVEFLAVPPKARISLQFKGNPSGAQAFIGLEKL